MHSARRASALVVTRGSRANRSAIETWWQRYGSGGPIFWVDFAITGLRRFSSHERLELPATPGPLFAFCALGHPEAFYADLLLAGLPWAGTRSFPDHQRVNPSDLKALEAQAQGLGATGLVCTEKDAVKFTSAHTTELPLWIAEQRLLGGEALLDYVLESLKAR